MVPHSSPKVSAAMEGLWLVTLLLTTFLGWMDWLWHSNWCSSSIVYKPKDVLWAGVSAWSLNGFLTWGYHPSAVFCSSYGKLYLIWHQSVTAKPGKSLSGRVHDQQVWGSEFNPQNHQNNNSKILKQFPPCLMCMYGADRNELSLKGVYRRNRVAVLG